MEGSLPQCQIFTTYVTFKVLPIGNLKISEKVVQQVQKHEIQLK
jgi:hypothetical protein